MSRRRPVTLAAAVLGVAMGLFIALRPPAGGALAQTPMPPAGSITLGRDLYLRDCAWCHGPAGQGSTRGPTLSGVGAASADFMLSTGRMPIPRPEVQPERAEAPYTPDQIDAMVAYVASLGFGPGIPAVRPERGVLSEGARLYEENCAACHGSTGAGGALTSGLTAPALGSSTPVQVAEAIRIGGAGVRSGNMPRFGPRSLSDRQVDSIVRYVQYLRDPDDRGGNNLGHLGPIPEGFVAWAVGLLALVLVVRWIGTSE